MFERADLYRLALLFKLYLVVSDNIITFDILNQLKYMLVNLESEFKAYLDLVKLNATTMSPIQMQETKRAFYGGMGRLFRLITIAIDKVESDQEGGKCFQQIQDQINNFWITQIH